MSNNAETALDALGLDDELAASFAVNRPGLVIGRIVRHDRISLVAATLHGDVIVDVPGRMRRNRDALALPCIGDWVVLAPHGNEQRATLDTVLPRKSKLVRHVAGTMSTGQVLAANIDTLFLVSALDRDFNPRRIERYLTLAWQSGARPVVVLNKMDTCDDLAQRVSEATQVAIDAPVLAVSAKTRQGVDGLRPFLGFGKTGALVGSSGVGKSSLVNILLNEERLATGAVRTQDQRGRHVTTRRELVVLPERAGCLIDTPGLRELQLWGDENGLTRAFADVEAVAASCRFADCSHQAEPDCAVHRAIDAGELSTDRFENYQALRQELASLQTRTRERHSRVEGRQGAAAVRAADRWRR